MTLPQRREGRPDGSAPRPGRNRLATIRKPMRRRLLRGALHHRRLDSTDRWSVPRRGIAGIRVTAPATVDAPLRGAGRGRTVVGNAETPAPPVRGEEKDATRGLPAIRMPATPIGRGMILRDREAGRRTAVPIRGAPDDSSVAIGATDSMACSGSCRPGRASIRARESLLRSSRAASRCGRWIWSPRSAKASAV